MKLKFTLFFIIVLIVNFSCKKNTNFVDNNNSCPPTILLTTVTGYSKIETDGSLKVVNMKFSYNDNYRLVKIKDGSRSLDISYEKIYAFKLQYADSADAIPKRTLIDLSQIESPYRPLVEEESIFEGNKLLSKSRVVYTYLGDVSTEIKHTSSTGAILIEKYTFKDGNISSFDNGMGTVYTYKYGNKLNPFGHSLLMYRMGSTDFFSGNEVIEIEETTNGLKKMSRNIYTYNKVGYPVTLKTINSSGITISDVRFEYGSFNNGCY